MTVTPSTFQIIAAVLSALRGACAQRWRAVPTSARLALLPLAMVPLAALSALTVVQLSQPLPPVVKTLDLPAPAVAQQAAGHGVEDFAHLLEQVFGLDQERALLFSDWILEASARQQLPPELLASLIYTESSFRKRVRSWAGAIGPAQVMPHVWRDFCGGVDLLDPEYNIYCGAQVLAHYKQQCGDLDCALRLYNVGPGNLRLPRFQQAGQRYVTRIETNWGRFDHASLL